MPQPVSYSAQDVVMQERPAGVSPIKEVVPTDWERFLTRSMDHWAWLRDLRLWHTYELADRLARVENLVSMRGKELDDVPKIASDKRRRYLTIIMLREIEHPKGSAKVAQAALDALMGRKK